MAKQPRVRTKSGSTDKIKVKGFSEVLAKLNQSVSLQLHDRFNAKLSRKNQKRLVAYGPWLAGLLILVIIPELLILASFGNLVSPLGFMETIMFNQEAWVLLLIMFVNCLLMASALSALFNQQKIGWQRVYLAVLISSLYAGWKLLINLSNPAPAILSLIGFSLIIFVLLDVKSYYQKSS